MFMETIFPFLRDLSSEQLGLIVTFLSAVCGGSAFAISLWAVRKARIAEKMDVLRSFSVKDYAKDKLQKAEDSKYSYDALYAKLRRNGLIGGTTRRQITPEVFILIKILCTVIVFVFGLSMGVGMVGAILAIPAFYLMDLEMKWSNKRDNSKMHSDIVNMYSKLSIQLESGVHIGDSFVDCYYYTGNARLKKALSELNAQIALTHDVLGALKDFERKFNNKSITVMVQCLAQSMMSGGAVRVLDDLRKEMRELQRSENNFFKTSLERKQAVIIVLVFASIVFMLIHCMMEGFMTEVMQYF